MNKSLIVSFFAWRSFCLMALIASVGPGICRADVHLHGFAVARATGCCVCPQCQHRCQLKAERVEEERECFEVESKVVCIPRVVFPWQKQCCDPCFNNGARTRRVCVLKTETYQCPKCEYSWTLENGVGGGACDMIGGCDLRPHSPEQQGFEQEPSDQQRFEPQPVEYESVNATLRAPVTVDVERHDGYSLLDEPVLIGSRGLMDRE